MEKPRKKIVIYFYILFSIFLFSACDYSYQKQIGDSYFIRCIENRYRMDIGFGTKDNSEILIEQTVFEVFWDEKYILVKRHPDFESNRKLVEYYILEKVVFGEKRARDYMIGPLTRASYVEKINKLNLNTDKMKHVVFDDLK